MNVIAITLKPGVNNYPVAKGNPRRAIEIYPSGPGVFTALFEVDETTGAELWSRLEKIRQDPAAARRRAQAVMARVKTLQQGMVEALRRTLAKARGRV